jgi:hypothetical protein
MKKLVAVLSVAVVGVFTWALCRAAANGDGWGPDAGTDAGWSDYRAAKAGGPSYHR